MQTSGFLGEDFLLHSEVARELYHRYAAPEPIYDYHCHLAPDRIAGNEPFRNLYEIWLAGDHYKWRVMRANGVEEKFITGDASDYEKFLAFARTVPRTLRNPLYHWTHLELRRYFGIEELLDETTAEKIWHTANERLASPEMSPQGILTSQRVTVVCTTDDPTDNLGFHKIIETMRPIPTRVYPCFRPDKALLVDKPELFNDWCEHLSAASEIDCGSFSSFLDGLSTRHAAFHALGCRLSDHGLPHCYAGSDEREAERIFDKARAGQPADLSEIFEFRGFMMLYFGRLDAEKGWTKQLHLGAIRNTNTRLAEKVGPDSGFDTIGDWPQAQALAIYLDQLDRLEKLPKTILYNLNPADNFLFAAMAGNFQEGPQPGKIQFGPAWWFLDQKQGIERHLDALSNAGLLSRFVGMTTDSRSFLSYPRHEYFRRILCDLLGRGVAGGELPHDLNLLGGLVRDLSYRNAHAWFGLDVPNR